MMMATQFIAAKVGMVTGKGLTAVLREHYPRAVLYPAILGLAIANTINAGADIGAIGAAVNLLIPVPIVALIVPIALLILALQVWGSYRMIAGVFKWITLALLAYIGAALLPGRICSTCCAAPSCPRCTSTGHFFQSWWRC